MIQFENNKQCAEMTTKDAPILPSTVDDIRFHLVHLAIDVPHSHASDDGRDSEHRVGDDLVLRRLCASATLLEDDSNIDGDKLLRE